MFAGVTAAITETAPRHVLHTVAAVLYGDTALQTAMVGGDSRNEFALTDVH